MKTDTDETIDEDETRWIEARKTRIGQGLFALRDFEADVVLGEMKGEVRRKDQFTDYCVDLAGLALLEPDPPFRFLNHSCDPNCQLIQWKSRSYRGKKVPRIAVRTIREIIEGEELTIDYAWTSDDAIPCLCGAANCRGFVVAAHEQPRKGARRMGIRRTKS